MTNSYLNTSLKREKKKNVNLTVNTSTELLHVILYV